MGFRVHLIDGLQAAGVSQHDPDKPKRSIWGGLWPQLNSTRRPSKRKKKRTWGGRGQKKRVISGHSSRPHPSLTAHFSRVPAVQDVQCPRAHSCASVAPSSHPHTPKVGGFTSTKRQKKKEKIGAKIDLSKVAYSSGQVGKRPPHESC